jgi:hypothetical protein
MSIEFPFGQVLARPSAPVNPPGSTRIGDCFAANENQDAGGVGTLL